MGQTWIKVSDQLKNLLSNEINYQPQPSTGEFLPDFRLSSISSVSVSTHPWHKKCWGWEENMATVFEPEISPLPFGSPKGPSGICCFFSYSGGWFMHVKVIPPTSTTGLNESWICTCSLWIIIKSIYIYPYLLMIVKIYIYTNINIFGCGWSCSCGCCCCCCWWWWWWLLLL